MKLQKFPQLPPEIAAMVEADSRSQFGALCYRKAAGELQVLLITSRGTGRWIVPKGWPVRGQTPAGSALIEAYEEAGVRGVVHPVCLGMMPRVSGFTPSPEYTASGGRPEASSITGIWLSVPRGWLKR